MVRGSFKLAVTVGAPCPDPATGAVGKPTTTGKIERWFGTYDREAWRFETLDDFLFYYNQVRPHQSLDYEKPLEVSLADPLPFH